jgi:hypothetical protein
MDYLIGSAISFLTIFIIGKVLLKEPLTLKPNSYRYSQSHVHSLIKPLLPPVQLLKPKRISQAIKHDEKNNIRVVIVGHDAYWIRENVFYTAQIDQDGVDKDTTRVVDTMSMDKVQLDKMLFIMDQLRDGEISDSGSTGND